MKTLQKLDNGRMLINEFHLCCLCFRMIHCNIEMYASIEKEGKLYFSHYRCKPLKQVLAK